MFDEVTGIFHVASHRYYLPLKEILEPRDHRFPERSAYVAEFANGEISAVRRGAIAKRQDKAEVFDQKKTQLTIESVNQSGHIEQTFVASHAYVSSTQIERQPQDTSWIEPTSENTSKLWCNEHTSPHLATSQVSIDSGSTRSASMFSTGRSSIGTSSTNSSLPTSAPLSQSSLWLPDLDEPRSVAWQQLGFQDDIILLPKGPKRVHYSLDDLITDDELYEMQEPFFDSSKVQYRTPRPPLHDVLRIDEIGVI